MANTPYIDLVKPAGTDKALISVLNANSDKIDSAVGGVQDALAIVCNGNTHGAITSGQYVYVRAHETLQEGLYTANSNIAANATLSSSNLTANSSGGLNALNEQIGNLNSKLEITSGTVTEVQALTTSEVFFTYTIQTSGWYTVRVTSANTAGLGLSRLAISNTVVMSVCISLGKYDQLIPPPMFIKAGTTIKGMAGFPEGGTGSILKIS